MAKFRGSNGSVTLAGGAVGNLTSFEFQVARDVLDATVMGDTAKKTGLDIPGASGTLTALFDALDTAQAAIMDIVITNTDVVTLAGVFIVAAGKQFSCNIVPTGAAVSSQKGQYVQVSFPWQSDGAITKTWS